MNTSARFFCENCNAEVKADARFCGKCGKFFISVRCPACGKSGSQNMFSKGCPACGYAGAMPAKKAEKEKYPARPAVRKNKKNVSGDLPVWIYGIIAVVLGTVIYMLITEF